MRSGTAVCVVVATVAACSCGPTLPTDLDAVEADRAVLAESTVLAYLQAAHDRADLRVVDLFRDENLRFARAPDPSELFTERHAEAEAVVPPAVAQKLRVVSYNLGLLDRAKILGFIDRVVVPELDVRRVAAPDLILGRGDDVVLLQELWELSDLDRFAEAARRHGYRLWGGSVEQHPAHGLAILIREDVLDTQAGEEKQEVSYEVQYDLENFPGPGFRRGYLSWRVTTADGLTVHLFNTHTTAFPEHWRVRMAQVRQLGLAVRAVPAEDLVLVGGDFNSGAFYVDDTWTLGDGSTSSGWWNNAVAYPLLLHYGELRDLMVDARPARDVELALALPRHAARSLETPYGVEGYCDRHAGQVFTATDCNSLYFRSYAGQEYPVRMDLLLVRASSRAVYAASVDLIFVEKLEFEDAGRFELSDHYGVAADLRVGLP
ncbi:MAG: endonuclease/exonuclease/phosphatase family protein [Pseudomonadota bacterium]